MVRYEMVSYYAQRYGLKLETATGQPHALGRASARRVKEAVEADIQYVPCCMEAAPAKLEALKKRWAYFDIGFH